LDVFAMARKLGYVKVPDDILVDPGSVDKYWDDELVFLTTGNHGKSVQAISEIASGSHPYIRIKKSDVVLFSSVAIQGNEIEFNRTLNTLEEKGVKVEFQDLHATGHACADELKLLFSMVRPKFVIPAHGEYKSRREAKKIASEVGILPENIPLIQNGDIVLLDKDGIEVSGKVPLNEILIDGYEKRLIDNSVIRDRRQLSESGIVIALVCIDKQSGRIVSPVKLISRGFMDEKRFDELSDKLNEIISKEISRFIGQGVYDERVRRGISSAARKFIEENTGKTPLVIAQVTDVML
ncbi:MAG: ribonuclease J, partial [Butyrivibrio sp.]|nr:ribonuclease J [Butyrivibrio sp.]